MIKILLNTIEKKNQLRLTKNTVPELSIINFGPYLQFFHRTYHIINVADHAVNLTINTFHLDHILAVLFLRFKSFHFGNEFLEDVKFFCNLV